MICKKQWIAMLAIVVLGVGAGAYVLRAAQPKEENDRSHGAAAQTKEHTNAKTSDAPHGEHEHANEGATSPSKGPKGGKLFVQAGYGLEVTIFETDVEPEFRIYTYRNGQPIAPSMSQVQVTLERLGRKPQLFTFAPERDYLKAPGVVEEPHSFVVKVASQYAGKAYQFGYEQIEARVSLTEAQMKSSGVEVSTVGPARIQSTVQLGGEVALNQDRSVQVVPRLGGLVESVSFSAGDKIKKGQVLAVVSSQQLADQRSEWQTAGKRLALARSTFEREKQLWQQKISAHQDYLQAQQALHEAEIAEQAIRQKLNALGALGSKAGGLTRFEIRSPIDGVITAKKLSVGEVVKEDTHILTVADLSTVWVDLNLYAKDLGAMKPGQKATVNAASVAASAHGKVSYVGALMGTQTRTALARIVLPNPNGVWHPGLPVTVEVVAAEIEVPMAVAQDALQTLRDAPVVFARYGDNFEARPVVTGRSDGHVVEITKGLEVGEKIAVRNSYLIKADIGKASASHDH
jgi:membrane fusion protein, heavy metal efflux system